MRLKPSSLNLTYVKFNYFSKRRKENDSRPLPMPQKRVRSSSTDEIRSAGPFFCSPLPGLVEDEGKAGGHEFLPGAERQKGAEGEVPRHIGGGGVALPADRGDFGFGEPKGAPQKAPPPTRPPKWRFHRNGIAGKGGRKS